MLLIDWMLKASVLLAVALMLVWLSRRRSAAFRHTVLAAAILAALALPVLSLLSPEWKVAVPSTLGAVQSLRPMAMLPTAAVTAGRSASDAAAGATAPSVGVPREGSIVPLVWAWLAGLASCLVLLLAGIWRLGVLRRAAAPDSAGEWQRLADRECGHLGLRPVQILFSPEQPLPITWGAVRPRILLPASAAGWPVDRRRIVVLHELAHVERGDWAWHLAAELLRAVFWFNPLSWIARRRLRRESEAACDDRVLALGVAGVDYASELLELARGCGERREEYLPAPAILRPSSLERRVRAMLNPSLDRTAVSRRGRGAIGVVAAVFALALGGVTAAQTFATFASSVVDPTNAVLPQVTFVLTNAVTGAKHEVQTGRDGRVELPGLEPGDYSIEAKLPGFLTFRSRIALVGGQRFEPAMMLQVGEIDETVHVSVANLPAGQSASDDSRPRVPTPMPSPDPRCSAPQGVATPGSIGGNIRPPRRLKNVPPQYPANLLGTGRGGSVQLRGRIGTDGRVEDLQVVGTADQDLAASAMAAASQWEYSCTLLNGQPWPVAVNVLVRYQGE